MGVLLRIVVPIALKLSEPGAGHPGRTSAWRVRRCPNLLKRRNLWQADLYGITCRRARSAASSGWGALRCRVGLVLVNGGRRAEQLGELDEVDGFG